MWFNLVEGPRKAVTKRVPLAHLSPRSLKYFYPLVACVALEFMAQLALVSIETLAPPLLRLWGGFSCDALGTIPYTPNTELNPKPGMRVRGCEALCVCVCVCVGIMLCIRGHSTDTPSMETQQYF